MFSTVEVSHSRLVVSFVRGMKATSSRNPWFFTRFRFEHVSKRAVRRVGDEPYLKVTVQYFRPLIIAKRHQSNSLGIRGFGELTGTLGKCINWSRDPCLNEDRKKTELQKRWICIASDNEDQSHEAITDPTPYQ